MARKHSPGCYCCDNIQPCPECCDPEEVIPSNLHPNIGNPEHWTRADRSYDPDCCCLQERWVYTETDPIYSCCQLLKYDSWTTQDHRIDHNLQLPSTFFKRVYGSCSADCPTSEEDCCITSDYQLGEWNEDITGIHNHYFAVKFYLDLIDISWTRELVRCPGDSPGEPECRYVIKVVGRGRYEARINTHLKVQSTATNVSHHPCFPLSPECTPGIPNCTQIFEGCKHPDFTCEVGDVDTGFTPVDHPCEPGPYENCRETQGPNGCYEQSGEFCWSRIKYFDTAPTGTVSFTSSDTITEPIDPSVDCDEPVCKSFCSSGYVTEIVVQSPAQFARPGWCDNPPTIENYTTTNVLEYTWCGNWLNPLEKFTMTGQTCCEGAIQQTSLCDPVLCENPYTITTNCDRLTWQSFELETGCQFTTRFGPLFLCGQGGFLPWNAIFDTNTRLDCGAFSPISGGLGSAWRGQLGWYNCFSGFFPGYTGPCPPTGTPGQCCFLLECPDLNDPECTGQCGCVPLTYPAGFVKSLDITLTIDCQAYTVKECTYPIPTISVVIS